MVIMLDATVLSSFVTMFTLEVSAAVATAIFSYR